MRRFIIAFLAALFAAVLVVPQAVAGSPHFVGDITVVRTGDSLTVSGKIAGLGDEDQVSIRVTADAQCVNPGGNHPSAGNKESFAAEGQFPVQNGKANFSLTLTATFQPSCSPPMTVVFSNVVVTDLTHGLTRSIPGTF
ncbi:MAG TPA: hypothetical protein VIP77_22325 [Jiangellaceae bacterium]